MKTKYLIVGGGLSGLAMALMCQKAEEDFILVESREEIPDTNIHYFHEDISSATGIKLRKVDIIHTCYFQGSFINEPSIGLMNLFSKVTTGMIYQNSMKYIDGKLKQGFVPVFPIISTGREMAKKLNYGCMNGKLVSIIEPGIAKIEIPHNECEIEYDRMISTIPLPAMLRIVGFTEQQTDVFKTKELKVSEIKFREKLFHDIWQIIYLPEAIGGYARLSILGNRIVAEGGDGFYAPSEEKLDDLKRLLRNVIPTMMGDISIATQVNPYGRYLPVDESIREESLNNLEKFRITALGRYAEWSYRRAEDSINRAKVILKAFEKPKGLI